MKKHAFTIPILVGCLGFAACNSSGTWKRAGEMGLGAAAGAAAGYQLGGKKPGAMIAGAGAGSLLTALAVGDDAGTLQKGFDDGYVRGQSDAIKRQYFLRQALEARPPAGGEEQGQSVFYTMPGPTVTVDGRKLEPHTVTVRVIE